jgi:tetratricopeptide (TPR) repeat protein
MWRRTLSVARSGRLTLVNPWTSSAIRMTHSSPILPFSFKYEVPITSTPGRTPQFMEVESDIAGMQRKIREFYTSVAAIVVKYSDADLSYICRQGDFESALDMAEICRDCVENHFGHDHPVFASTLNNIALMQKNLSRLDEAIQTYEEALRIYKNSVGESHASFATAMHNLGGVYRLKSHTLSGMAKIESMDEALACFQESLRIRRDILAEDHPDIAISMSNVGTLLWHTNKKTEGEAMLVDALKKLQTQVGPGSPLTALAMNNLACIYKDSGKKIDHAIDLFHEAIRIRKQTLGERHGETITSMHNLAEALRAFGREDEAAALQQQILILVDTSETDEKR